MSRLHCIPVLCVLFVLIDKIAPQTISLRHPESQSQPNPQANAGKPAPKPGDVVVKFDRNRDILNLQYVLSDGRLATLYRRNHQNSQQIGSQTVAQPAGAIVQQEQAVVNQQQQLQHPQRIDENTVVLASGENHDLARPIVHSQEDVDKMEIMAEMALDAIAAGAPKAGKLLDKLKGKVSAKLQQLPSIIGAKLRAKSSLGQVFLDKAGKKVIMLSGGEDETIPTIFQQPAPYTMQMNLPQQQMQPVPQQQQPQQVAPAPQQQQVQQSSAVSFEQHSASTNQVQVQPTPQ